MTIAYTASEAKQLAAFSGLLGRLTAKTLDQLHLTRKDGGYIWRTR